MSNDALKFPNRVRSFVTVLDPFKVVKNVVVGHDLHKLIVVDRADKLHAIRVVCEITLMIRKRLHDADAKTLTILLCL